MLDIFAIICDEDETYGMGLAQEKIWTERGERAHVLAASAITFSRNWHAPPPLTQFSWGSTLQETKISGIEVRRRCNLLVCTVKCDVNRGVLVNIAKDQTCIQNQFLRLKPYRSRLNLDNTCGKGKLRTRGDENTVFVDFRTLLHNPLHDVRNGGTFIAGSIFNVTLAVLLIALEPIPMTWNRLLRPEYHR
jgi:hypothetical protein